MFHCLYHREANGFRHAHPNLTPTCSKWQDTTFSRAGRFVSVYVVQALDRTLSHFSWEAWERVCQFLPSLSSFLYCHRRFQNRRWLRLCAPRVAETHSHPRIFSKSGLNAAHPVFPSSSPLSLPFLQRFDLIVDCHSL